MYFLPTHKKQKSAEQKSLKNKSNNIFLLSKNMYKEDIPDSKAIDICLFVLSSILEITEDKEKSKKSIIKFSETKTST